MEGWNELATTRARSRSVDWPSLGGNSFERRSESERMENGAPRGIERDALFNREMRTCWSVREGTRSFESTSG